MMGFLTDRTARPIQIHDKALCSNLDQGVMMQAGAYAGITVATTGRNVTAIIHELQ